MLVIIGYLFILIGFVASIVILIDAFKNAVWKGILGFFCGLYLLYYAFTEFTHEKKMLIIGAMIGGYVIGYALMTMGAVGAVAGAR